MFHISNKRIEKILFILQTFYLVLVILSVFVVVVGYFISREIQFDGLWGILISLVLYVGIKTRKSWLAPVIVLIATYSIISLLFTQPETIQSLVIKILGLSLHIFYLYFFTRKEVLKTFGRKGILIW